MYAATQIDSTALKKKLWQERQLFVLLMCVYCYLNEYISNKQIVHWARNANASINI